MITVYKANVKVQVDTDGVNNWLKLEEKNREALIRQTKAESRLTAEDRKKLEELRQRFTKATTQAEKNKILAEFDKLNNNYLALQKYKEGNAFYDRGRY